MYSQLGGNAYCLWYTKVFKYQKNMNKNAISKGFWKIEQYFKSIEIIAKWEQTGSSALAV